MAKYTNGKIPVFSMGNLILRIVTKKSFTILAIFLSILAEYVPKLISS